MTKKVFRLNIFQFVIDNFIRYVLLLQGLIFIFLPSAYSFLFGSEKLHAIGQSTFLVFGVLSLLIALVIITGYAYYLKNCIVVDIDSRQVRFEDSRFSKTITVDIVEIEKIIPRKIVLDVQEYLSLKITPTNNMEVDWGEDWIGWGSRYNTQQSFETRRAIVMQYGGGHWEHWYGNRWLEILTKSGKSIIPVGSFDSKTRKEIEETLRKYS